MPGVVRRAPVGKGRGPEIAMNLPEAGRHASHAVVRIHALLVVQAWSTQATSLGEGTEMKRLVGEFDRHGVGIVVD